LKIKIVTQITDVNKDITDTKSVELRALTLFQNINALGNYSDAKWFLDLNKIQLMKLVREIIDIWNYRAHLTVETKRHICPPYGNPFCNLPPPVILNSIENLDELRKIILIVLEKLVNTGINNDNKCLGAYYVLGSLTLVNNDVALALPWLYQAVCYNV